MKNLSSHPFQGSRGRGEGGSHHGNRALGGALLKNTVTASSDSNPRHFSAAVTVFFNSERFHVTGSTA